MKITLLPSRDRISYTGGDDMTKATMPSRFSSQISETRSQTRSLIHTVCLITLVGSFGLATLQAEPIEESSWVTDDTGAWIDFGNWDFGVPGSEVNAIIDQGNAVIGASDSAVAKDLTVGSSGTGVLTITDNGNLVTESGWLGSGTGSNGTATVTGTWNNTGQLHLGGGGAGTLTIQSGGIVSNSITFMGKGESAEGSIGTATIRGTWNTDDLYLGNKGTGTVTIESGGTVNGTRVFLGNEAGSNGTATVSGTWDNSGDMYIGLSGTGSLTIESGGDVRGEFNSVGRNEESNGTLNIASGGSLTSRKDGDIGYATGSTGTATVSGEWINTENFRVGSSGDGTLTIESGGLVSNGKDGWIAAEAGSTGTATVSGTWTNTENLYVGNSGTGTLTIESGGSVTNGKGVIGSNEGSSGEVTVSGSWTNDGDLDVGHAGNGTLTIKEGGSVSNDGFALIGVSSTSISKATVRGTWDSSSQLRVGENGTGTLDIESGGTVTDMDGILGTWAGSNGTANVSGTWTRNGTGAGKVVVGNSGTGTLNIKSGGSVVDAGSFIGYRAGSTGTANVSGEWTNSGTMTVGYSSDGTLNIEDGGVVSAAAVILGFDGDGDGAIEIEQGGTLIAGQISKGDGAAALTVDGGTVRASADQSDFLSNFGVGEVLFTSGGAVFDTDGHEIEVAAPLSGEGGLTKSGAGTLLLSGSNSYTGVTDVAEGMLEINGHLTGSSRIDVESGATLGGMGIIDGDVTIKSGGILVADDNPGALALGSLTLDPGATLSFKLGDFSDPLAVNGQLTLGGTLSISLADGFSANVGDLFDIVAFESVDGAFSDIQGLVLGDGLAFQTVWNEHGLVLTVIPEPSVSLLLITGLAGFGALGLKRKKRQV